MSDMYLKLGTQNLTGKVYDDITQPGGYFDIKQDGATSLRTGARKGDPKGSSCSFFVCFDTEAAAKAFLAYVAPYSPEDPDFDEKEGADIDLYVRTADWMYKVWGVVTKAAPLNKTSTDYLQYCYEVVCYLCSPYSEAAVPTEISIVPVMGPLDLASSASNSLLAVDQYYKTLYFGSDVKWHRFGNVDALRISGAVGEAIVGTNHQIYQYSGGWVQVGSGSFADVSKASDNSVFGVGTDNKVYKWSGSAWSEIGFGLAVSAVSANLIYVVGTDHVVSSWNGSSWTSLGGYVADVSTASDGTLICVTMDSKVYLWSGSAWVFLRSGILYAAVSGANKIWVLTTDYVTEYWNGESWSSALGGQAQPLDNADGHIASSPDIAFSCSYDVGRVADLAVAIAESETLILATQANSAETWELRGNLKKVIQTYEDLVTDAVTWLRDVTSPATSHYTTGTPAIGWIEVHAGEAPYFRLSGPHRAGKPAKLWAPIIASGACSIEISSDTVEWQEVLSELDFHAAGDSDATKAIATEFSLPETVYGYDIYVRFRCDTGNMWIGSVKFEVERWIEDGAVPVVAAGAIKVMTVSATGGAIAVTGTFAPRQKFI